MLMRKGAVLAAGPLHQVFTARNLSRCFGVPLIVERRAARWMAHAAPVR
jgi:iron complex transport system ATP-binding protein